MDAENYTKLRFEFYKNLGTLALAALGGEVTLVHTVFSGVAQKSLPYVSIGCLFLAAMAAQAAQETLLNRISPPPRFGHRLLRIILTPRLRSIEAQYACEGFSAVMFGLGLALFAVFVWGR